jgi:hypothetical protein
MKNDLIYTKIEFAIGDLKKNFIVGGESNRGRWKKLRESIYPYF